MMLRPVGALISMKRAPWPFSQSMARREFCASAPTSPGARSLPSALR
jgi:hypothetical protein